MRWSDTFPVLRYPKSSFGDSYVEFDVFAVGERLFFCQKGRSECGFAVIAELLVGEAGKDGSLAHSGVSHCDEFDLAHFFSLLLAHYRFIIHHYYHPEHYHGVRIRLRPH